MNYPFNAILVDSKSEEKSLKFFLVFLVSFTPSAFILLHRKTLSAGQALSGQLTDTGERDRTTLDHSGTAKTERLQRTAAEPRG